MAYDFPASPSVGQTFTPSGGPTYTWDGEKWKTYNASLIGSVRYDQVQTLTATQKALARANIDVLKKNYLVNNAMMISQENGTTAGSVSGYFPVDQFRVDINASPGAISAAQVASLTPGGSPNRLRITVTAADTSIAAGEYCTINQPVEGARIADLRLGTASAKTITIQFGCKGPAGVYTVALRNGTANRCFVAEYTITAGEANTDVVKSVTIPLDQTGAWSIDSSVGMNVTWSLSVGSTYHANPWGWGGANAFGSATMSNFLATNGNVFELFDVGLYEGSNAPSYQLPDYPSELSLCQRYFHKMTSGVFNAAGTIRTGGTTAYITFKSPQPMRASPVVAYSGAVQVYCGDTGANITALAAGNYDATTGIGVIIPTMSALGSVGQACLLYTNTGNVTFNARY